ncbi:hypothetical protein ACVIIW_000951 [Bradyrhizobium sp. USDA 4449]
MLLQAPPRSLPLVGRERSVPHGTTACCCNETNNELLQDVVKIVGPWSAAYRQDNPASIVVQKPQ